MHSQADPPLPQLPPQSLNYLELIGFIFYRYRNLTGFDELLERYGPNSLREVTNHPFYRQMNTKDPLPQDFIRRHFHFFDTRFGNGTMEIVFRGERLVCVRTMQFFAKGWFKVSKAKKFLIRVLVPYMEQFFGDATEQTTWTFWFTAKGICGLAGWVPGQPAVTTCLIDEEYK